MQTDKLGGTKAAGRLSGSSVLPSPSQYVQRNSVHEYPDDSWQFDELIWHDSDSHVPSIIRRWLLGVLAVGATLLVLYLVWNAHNGNAREQFQFINQRLSKRTESGQHIPTIVYVAIAVVILVCALILLCLFGERDAGGCSSMGDACIGCDSCYGDCGNCSGDCNC